MQCSFTCKFILKYELSKDEFVVADLARNTALQLHDVGFVYVEQVL